MEENEENKDLKNLDLDLSILQNALIKDENTDTNEHSNENEEISTEQQDDPSSEETKSPLFHFAKYLSDEGIFAEDELKDFDGTPDSLVTKITNLADRLAEEKVKNYSPEAKKFMELVNSGVDESEAKKITLEARDLNKISEEDIETNSDIQKSIIKKYLEKTGLSEEDIEEQITFFEDTDKLYTKALNHYTKLKSLNEKEEQLTIDKAKRENEEAQKEYDKQLADVKDRITKTKEIIPGFALTDAMKDKIYKNITTPAKIENGVPISTVALKRQKDPVQFEITLNLLNELGVFDGKFDLLLNAGKKKSVEELENAIKTSDFFNKSTSKKQNDKTQEMLDSIKDMPTFKF